MESIASIWVLVAVTAVFTAVLTMGLFALIARRFVASTIENAGDTVAAKVRCAVDEAVEEALPRLREAVASGLEEAGSTILPELRAEVEKGVVEGAKDVLPDLRKQVREGFSEALGSAVTGGILGAAGEELVRKGSGVLDRILGPVHDRDET